MGTTDYDMEIKKIISTIHDNGYRRICLQFPDGLKQHAKEVVDTIEQQTHSEVILWAGSNYGACDLSLDVKKLGVDLLVHFGHSKWVFDDKTFSGQSLDIPETIIDIDR